MYRYGGSGTRSQSSAAAPEVSMAPGKVIGEKDNLFHFSGEAKDWSSFKEGMKTLRAALKEGDQRLSALETKFHNFSHKAKDGVNTSTTV